MRRLIICSGKLLKITILKQKFKLVLIFTKIKIILSALLTESEYILVSHGKLKAVERLQNYLKRKM